MARRSIFARTWELVRPYRWRLVGALILLLLLTGLGLLPPVFAARIIGRALPSAAAPGGDTQLFLICAAGFLIAQIASALVGLFQRHQMRIIGGRLVLDLRRKMYRHLHRLSLSFYESRSSGEIMSRLMNDVQTLANLVTGTALDAIVSVFKAVAILIVLLIADWRIALLALVLMPLHFLGAFVFKSRLAHESWRSTEKTSQIYGKANEVLDAAKVVKAYSAENRETHMMLAQLRENYEVGVRAGLLTSSWQSSTAIISHTGSWLVMIACGMAVLNSQGGQGMTVEQYVLFLAYVGMLYAPIGQLIGVAHQLIPARIGLQRVFEIMDLQPEVETPIHGQRRRLVGRVRFENVCFAYPEGKQVLHGISFTAEPGQMIALVGPSGSGKSTIANLLARFYDRTAGTIELDGLDIQSHALNDLRHQMSIVLQETHLFRGTIEENLRYGRPDATHEEIRRAAELANAQEFIMAMPDQYHTIIGARGARLSGGQKQRIAIARALLRDPRLLILDEATSALDSASEAKVQQALLELMRGRTTFVIAHRLSTIRHADRILVIKEGCIVQAGTHEELIDVDGLYRELYNPDVARRRTKEQEQAIEQLVAAGV